MDKEEIKKEIEEHREKIIVLKRQLEDRMWPGNAEIVYTIWENRKCKKEISWSPPGSTPQVERCNYYSEKKAEIDLKYTRAREHLIMEIQKELCYRGMADWLPDFSKSIHQKYFIYYDHYRKNFCLGDRTYNSFKGSLEYMPSEEFAETVLDRIKCDPKKLKILQGYI